jgi:hypothetical protein
MMLRQNFFGFAALSAVVALYSLSGPWISSKLAPPITWHNVTSGGQTFRLPTPPNPLFMFATNELGPLLWLCLFVVGLVLYGRRGLWLILGAPVAFFWFLFILACAPYDCP